MGNSQSFKKDRDSVSSRQSITNTKRLTSTDTDNFDTMMETPTALRYASLSLDSERGDRKKGKRGSRSKAGPGGQACCGSGSEGGGCLLF